MAKKELKAKKKAPSQSEMTQAQYEIKKYEQLKNDKSTVQNRLNQIAHYIFPRKYNIDVNGDNTTTDLPTDVYDGTAIYSLKVLAAGLASFLTNQSSKWFVFTAGADQESPIAKMWLQKLEKACYRLFNDSNFYSAMAEMYKTLGAFGNGILYSEEDKEKGKFYQTFDVMNCAFETDGKNRIIGVYREYYYTSLQCIEEFGESNVPEVVIADINGGTGSKKFQILHVVRPRRRYEEGKMDVKNKKVASTYYLMQTKDILKESGFDKFPYNVARFETNPNDPYGYGPAEDALPDIKSLNQAVYDWHESVQIANRPVIIFPSDSYGTPTDVAPGDIIFKQGGDPKEKIETIGGTNPNITLEMLKDIRDRIQKAFFVEMFMAVSNETKRMTVPEVQKRISEQMNIVGSSLNSLTGELLEPAVMDVVDTVIKLGWVEEAPEELQELNVRFVGPLARAQRNVDANAIQGWIQSVQQMAQTPELASALDVINATNSATTLADIMGVPVEDVNGPEEVKVIRDGRAKAQSAQIEQANAAQAAQTGKTNSETQKNLEA